MKILQLAEVHPLDRRRPSPDFPDIEVDEGNYHQDVRRAVTNILENVGHVSEKDFAGVDRIMAEADSICRRKVHVQVIEQCEMDGKRPTLCAEIIYDKMGRQAS